MMTGSGDRGWDDRVAGVMLGTAVGDALGAGYEYGSAPLGPEGPRMIGGGLGGLYAGITGVKCFSFCSPGLLALPAYIGTGGWTNLINAVISMLIGFIVPFVLVFVLKISGDTDETAEEIFSEEKPVKSQLGTEAA